MKKIEEKMKPNEMLVFHRYLVSNRNHIRIYAITLGVYDSQAKRKHEVHASNCKEAMILLNHQWNDELACHYQMPEDNFIDQMIKEEDSSFVIQKQSLDNQTYYSGMMGYIDSVEGIDIFHPSFEAPFAASEIDLLITDVNQYYMEMKPQKKKIQKIQ